MAERLTVVEQMRDAVVLFAQLERSLSTTWDFYYEAASSYSAIIFDFHEEAFHQVTLLIVEIITLPRL